VKGKVHVLRAGRYARRREAAAGDSAPATAGTHSPDLWKSKGDLGAVRPKSNHVIVAVPEMGKTIYETAF